MVGAHRLSCVASDRSPQLQLRVRSDAIRGSPPCESQDHMYKLMAYCPRNKTRVLLGAAAALLPHRARTRALGAARVGVRIDRSRAHVALSGLLPGRTARFRR